IVRIDALLVVALNEELDVAGERDHGPGRLREHCAGYIVRVGHAAIAFRHVARDERLDAPEQLLGLDLLVAEAHHRLERHLIPEPVLARLVEYLRADESLDESEQVRIGSSLHLTQRALLGLREERQLIDLRQAIGQELVLEAELAAPQDVAIDFPGALL